MKIFENFGILFLEISRPVLMDLDNIKCVMSSEDMEEEQRNAHHYHRRNSCSTNRKAKIHKYSCYVGDKTANGKSNTISHSPESETKLETITTTS